LATDAANSGLNFVSFALRTFSTILGTSATATSVSCVIIHRRKAEREASDIDLVRVQARVVAEVVASGEARATTSGQMDEARKSVTEAVDSLRLNFANIRQGQIVENNTRPIEVLQSIQALALARAERQW